MDAMYRRRHQWLENLTKSEEVTGRRWNSCKEPNGFTGGCWKHTTRG